MSRFLADCTHNRLTGIPNTHRIITNRHRRWNWITKRHLKMTGAIGHRRKITKIPEWMTPKDLNEDWTSQSGTSNGRTLTKTEQMDRSGAVTGIGTSPKRKEDPSRRSSQYSAVLHDTNTAVSEELYSTHFSWVQSSQQLWGNLSDSSGLVNFFRKMKHHTLVEAHFCKSESRCKMFNNTILTIVLKKRQVSFFVFKANGRAPSGECNARQTFHAKNILH